MKRLLAWLGVLAIFAGGIGIGVLLGPGGSPSDPSTQPRPRTGELPPATVLPDDLVLVASLSGFTACDDYLAHVREQALEQVGPYGLGGGGGGWWLGGTRMAAEAGMAFDGAGGMAAGDSAAAPAPSANGSASPGVSGTNVQEEGVDEPDRVKTDGDVAYVVVGQRLRILDIRGDDPVELASVSLGDAGWNAELLLHGDRLLVTSAGGAVIPFAGERIRSSVSYSGAGTTITSIDVSNPSRPVVAERLVLDGWVVSSRMVDGVARVVVHTQAGINIPWVYPEASGLRAEREATEANRRLIETSEAADWLPYYVHETATGTSREGVLLACNRVAKPAEFSGLGTLSVLTVDLDTGALVPDTGAVGLIAAGETVYASSDRLFVATTRWVDTEAEGDTPARIMPWPRPSGETHTDIHAFDISNPRRTEHVASGTVPGRLLSQWAMSDHEGVLRVASTVGDGWWGANDDSSSIVTTLRVEGDELAEVGQVGDLGPSERIYAVRFMGDVGYVVTFRETDPLYVLDLSDPADPQVTGELKIPGYSAYLHPLGDGLLLGVGQDAEEDGRRLGAQVSLFDVSDPTDPRRIGQIGVSDSYSTVEHDHKAFLHWPATGLTVVPVQRWWTGESPPQGAPNGALAFTADGSGFAGIGGRAPDELVLTHAEAVPGGSASERMAIWEKGWNAAINRAVVTGDRLLTFSEAGVRVHDLATLAERGALEY